MRLRSIHSVKQLKGKRVLIRVDGNVSVKAGRAVDGPNGKIARVAVDLEWLRQHGARLVVLTHLGRPGGKRKGAYTVAPVARRLSELLGVRVAVSRDAVGPGVLRAVRRLDHGDVLMLENLRFYEGEEQNSRAFAQQLAALGDVYVNDAFAVSHRAHASVDAITEELPSYAGPQLVQEVNLLDSLHTHTRRPFVLAMGGMKMTDKLPVLERLLPRVDTVLVGGALAHAFFVAQGVSIGRSAYERDGVPIAERLWKRWARKIRLPEDVCAVKRLSAQSVVRCVRVENLTPSDYIADIGPHTLVSFIACVRRAKTIVWNGPLGYCEVTRFCRSSQAFARAVASRTGKAKTIVGGGETIPVVESAKLSERFTLVSTGGGAMLEFLAGKKLPGLAALEV
jgi:phosphoglycerate kinase